MREIAPIYRPKAPALEAPHGRYSLLMVALLFFALAGAAALLFAMLDGGISFSIGKLYLWPWILMVMVVISAPPVYLMLRQRFDLFHPLVYASWSYFFPAFVLGSIFLATGLSEPSFMHLIPDQQYYLPLTLVYIALGYAGLTAGFAVPWGQRWGVILSRRLPVWNWRAAELLFPCCLLLIVGEAISIVALSTGAIGYQRAETIETFNAMLTSMVSFISMASFLLWFATFRAERLTLHHKIIIALLIALIPFNAIISGSRGGLINSLIPIGMAYWLCGQRIKLHHGTIFGIVLSLALLVGMVYGTTFRFVKGTEDRMSIEDYLSTSVTALEVISNRSLGDNLSFGFAQISERFETTTSLAVVVANHENLKSFEAGYGIEDNIWTYTWTAFIPRFLWPDKPVISDARAYSALYFDFGQNSFALTPIGDLLRNFGPVGIPLGMALLGFLLRIIYTTLIEGQTVSPWRAVSYYLMLATVSYESFYGTILPNLIRVSIILVLGGLLINALARRRWAA
jgi:oligosaccharide repeat unit polymerase